MVVSLPRRFSNMGLEQWGVTQMCPCCRGNSTILGGYSCRGKRQGGSHL